MAGNGVLRCWKVGIYTNIEVIISAYLGKMHPCICLYIRRYLYNSEQKTDGNTPNSVDDMMGLCRKTLDGKNFDLK